MSADMKDFILALLEKDPKDRLGTKGSYEVLEHPWLDVVKFDSLKKKKIIPPYIPDCEKV